MRKFPVFLLIDVSESMAGEGLVQLERGMRGLVSELMRDPQALETVWMSVIVFAGRPRTLVPLTELEDFVPPHLPIGGGTALGAALIHLMDEIDRNVQEGTKERKGDWRPLIILMTDGHPTDNPDAAIRRWQAQYRDRSSLVAVSIGGGGDPALLSRLTDEILSLDDTQERAFERFVVWITNSIKSSTRSVAAGEGISLSKMDDDLAGRAPGGLMFEGVDDRYAVMVGKCSRNRAPYLVKYERHLGRFQTQDEKLRNLFETRDYVLQFAVPLQEDYFELSDGQARSTQVSSGQLIGHPDCPHCSARYGMAVCACGGIHCVHGDGEATCPWCGKTGMYGSVSGGQGFEINRGQG